MDELGPNIGFQVTPAVKLVRPLSQGGMGKVWVAEHAGLKTEVVVKFMAPGVEVHADAATRFAQEASVAAAVKSPHVTQMLDYGTAPDGSPYIVMELLEGEDLGRRLARVGTMAPRDVAALIAQVSRALTKAHRVGIIHRDIKPDNIFLCDTDGGELFVKLLDFGIAKNLHELSPASTTTGQVVGTPYYMSPEQLVGDRVLDPRSDIWALGVVVFEAVTGRRPFDGTTIGAITLAVHSSPRPKIFREGLDGEGVLPALDLWFEKACAREPERRFSSAQEAAQALLEAVGEAPSTSLGGLRISQPSFPELDSVRSLPAKTTEAPAAREAASPPVVTSLSSAVPVAALSRRKLGRLTAFVAASALLLGAGVVALAMRSRGPEPERLTAVPSTAPPPSVETAPPAPTLVSAPLVNVVPSAEPEAARKPLVQKSTAPKSSSAPRPQGPRKKPANDDDIK